LLNETNYYLANWRFGGVFISMRGIKHLLMSISLLIISSIISVQADENRQQTQDYSIGAGDLSIVLTRFAETAGIKLLAPSDLLNGKRSPGLTGNYSKTQALEILLLGTGLNYHISDNNVVTIEPAPEISSEGPITIQPIYIDANKRGSEDIQDVAGSVYAYDRDNLEVTRTRGLEGVLQQTPNAHFDERVNGDIIIWLRGNTTDGNNTDAGIGIYVDGAYNYIQGNNNNLPLFDLDQVNVLLGPQGSLYGRNAVGGAINVETADPIDEFDTSVKTEVSEFGGRYVEGFVNVPVTDRIRLRASAFHNERDSYYFNTTNNQKEDGIDQNGARIKLGINPVDNLDIVLTAERLEQKLPGSAATSVANINAFTTTDDIIGNRERNSTRYNAEINWQFHPAMTFTSITGFNRPDGTTLIDSTGVTLSTVDTFKADQITQEFRLSSEENSFGQFDWLMGFNFFRDDISAIQRSNAANFSIGGVNMLGSGVTTDLTGKIKQYAVFGELSYEFVNKLIATVTLRASHETKRASTDNNGFGSAAQIGRLEAANFIPAEISEKDTYRRINPSASLSYDWTDRFSTYAKFATAYKSGGINSSTAPTTADQTFDPEDVYSIEFGFRSNWFNNKLIANGTIFHQIQKNLQIRSRDNNINYFTNVGDGQTDGAEVNLQLVPLDNLTLSASYGFLRPKITEAPAVQSGTTTIDAKGHNVPDIPAHTLNLSSQFDFYEGKNIDAFLRVEHYLTRGGVANIENTIELDNKNKTNFTIGVESENLSVNFFVDNLFDKDYFEFTPTDANRANGGRTAPRTAGLSATYYW
jgi:iron complex outermembrane recepter protein